jgi:hypothetical protein
VENGVVRLKMNREEFEQHNQKPSMPVV